LPKPNKQTIVDAIIKMIEQGKTYSVSFAVTGPKWAISETTFKRYWKIANQQHTDKQDLIKKQLLATDTAAAIDARKRAIMTADERKELLSKIAKGEMTELIPDTDPAKPALEVPLQIDAMVRIKAIAELNKMDGDYAPVKSNVVISKVGKEVEEEVYE